MSATPATARIASRAGGLRHRLFRPLHEAAHTSLAEGALVALCFVAVITVIVMDPAPLVAARSYVFDLFQRSARAATTPSAITLVDIDEAALEQYGLWPWPRATVARLVDRLADGGAAVVVLPVLMADADRESPAELRRLLGPACQDADCDALLKSVPDGDARLAAAMRRVPVITMLGEAEPVPGGHLPQHASITRIGAPNVTAVPRLPWLIGNRPELDATAAGHGVMVLFRNGDGVVRAVPMVVAVGGPPMSYTPTLAAEILRVATGARSIDMTTRSDDAGGGTVVSLRFGRGASQVVVPTDWDGTVRLFAPGQWQRPSLSAATVLGGGPLPDALKDHIVAINPTASALGRLFDSPIGPQPGMSLIADVVDQALNGKFLTRPDLASGIEPLVAAAMGLALLVMLWRRGIVASALLGLVLSTLLVLGSWEAFARYGILLDATHAIFAAAVLHVVASTSGYIAERHRRHHVNELFGRYMSPVLVAQLVADPTMVKLGGERRELSFIFTDVANFTTMSEQVDPTVLGPLMIHYLTGICSIILEHGGYVNDFIGDAVVAFFGAPLPQPDHARRALTSAREIDRYGERFRAEQQARGIPFGMTRIGVHTGPAMIGDFGSEQRSKYTALGDSVNTGSRIEGANKVFHTRASASIATVAEAGDELTRPIASVILKGRASALELHEILEEGFAPDRLAAYRAAYAKLTERSPEAAAAFHAYRDRFGPDACAEFHLARLAAGILDPCIEMIDK